MYKHNWSESFLENVELKSNPYGFYFELNYYQLKALKTLLIYYLKTNLSWTYTLDKNNKNRVRLIADDASRVNFFDINESYFNIDLLRKTSIHLVINADKFNHIEICAYLAKNNFKLSLGEKKIFLKKVSEKVKENLEYLFQEVKSIQLVPSYFNQNFELDWQEFTGFFDLDWIKLDFGAPAEVQCYNRIVKCEIKYYRILFNNIPFPVPVVETIDLSRKIIISLVQLILRVSFNKIQVHGSYYEYFDDHVSGEFELNSAFPGCMVKYERDIKNDLSYMNYQGFGMPTDAKELLNKFFSLEYDKQNAFILSCYSYEKALRSDSIEALMYFTVAIENLATFEFKDMERGKEDIIKDLYIKYLGDNENIADFISYFYTIRSKYVHQGIANNQLNNDAFGLQYDDKKHFTNMEQITNFILINWLISQ